MRRIIIMTMLIVLETMFVIAQDVIVKKDNSTIVAKVLEILPESVKYKKWSNPNGPIYTILNSDIIAINYENGEIERFDNSKENSNQNSHTNQGLIVKAPDERNEYILNLYNQVFTPNKKVKRITSPAHFALCFYKFTTNSILSNEDIEMKILRKDSKYVINLINKTDKVIYIDKGNCFRINESGEAFCYFDNTEQITTSSGSGSGISLGVGAIANAVGLGGTTIGRIANGIAIGGGQSSTINKAYSKERIVAIPPHGSKNLTDNRKIETQGKPAYIEMAEEFVNPSDEYYDGPDHPAYREESQKCGLYQSSIERGEIKTLTEDSNDISWSREYYITYSTDSNFETYSTLNAKLYTYEMIGGGQDLRSSWDMVLNINEPLNEYTLYGLWYLAK